MRMRRSRFVFTARISRFSGRKPKRFSSNCPRSRESKDPEIEPQAEQQAIEVEVDLDKARAYGLKPGDVRRAASALIGGITVGSLFQEQKIFDVLIWGRPDIRKDIGDIRNLLIDTEFGRAGEACRRRAR